jgi:hypothetical protein
MVVFLDYLDLAQEKHGNGSLPGYDPERFEGGIKQ